MGKRRNGSYLGGSTIIKIKPRSLSEKVRAYRKYLSRKQTYVDDGLSVWERQKLIDERDAKSRSS